MDQRHLGLLSVVTPVLDEEEVLLPFYERLCRALEGFEWELVVVDDGSGDSTPALLRQLADRDRRVRVVMLSRHFGFQPAVTAGLDNARGDAVVTIDADLQDPPELIPELVAAWRRGSDVVYAVRETRAGESWVKLTTARWLTRLFIRLAGLDAPANAGDFRLLDRRVLTALQAMPERNRFLRGLTVWVGFTQTSVPYRRAPRHAGRTSYTWRSLLITSVGALSSFSRTPLRLASLFGLAVSFLALLGIPYVVVSTLLDVSVEGLSTVLFAILLLGGIQLITLGIIGEYVGRIYDEVKGRPLYVVRERLNAVTPAPADAGEEPVATMDARR